MYNRKLTQSSFGDRRVSERFSRLQHSAELSSQGRSRVEEAMKAAVAHVEKKQGLQYGMQGQHLDMAMDYLDKHYEGRHDLLPKERKVIEDSFKSHFEIKEPDHASITPTPPPSSKTMSERSISDKKEDDSEI